MKLNEESMLFALSSYAVINYENELIEDTLLYTILGEVKAKYRFECDTPDEVLLSKLNDVLNLKYNIDLNKVNIQVILKFSESIQHISDKGKLELALRAIMST